MKTLKNLFWNLALCAFTITSSLTADVISAVGPVIKLDANGNGVAIWQGWDDNNAYVIRGATMAAGGDWNSPVTLSNVAYSSYLNNISPTENLAVNDAGNALAVWISNVEAASNVYAIKLIDSVWELDATLLSDEVEYVAFYDLVAKIDNTESENVTVLWSSYLEVDAAVRGATGTLAGTWSSPFTLDPVFP